MQTREWQQVVPGLSIGDMSMVPYREEFDVVATIGGDHVKVDDGIFHRHVPGRGAGPDEGMMITDWLTPRLLAGKRCLIRSEDTLSAWAQAIDVLVRLGASKDEAAHLAMDAFRRLEGDA